MNYNFDALYDLQKKNEWFKPKHLTMYRDFAFRAAQESYAKRRKVGAVILSNKGSLFIGYNGTPPNEDNCCEDENFNTKSNVIHAEDNAIRKMVAEDVDTNGSIIFITDSPCNNCATDIILKYGIQAVFYFRHYYRDLTPLQTLDGDNVLTQYVDEDYLEELRQFSV